MYLPNGEATSVTDRDLSFASATMGEVGWGVSHPLSPPHYPAGRRIPRGGSCSSETPSPLPPSARRLPPTLRRGATPSSHPS